MFRDFDLWNILKKRVEFEPSVPYFHPREIWFARLGKNVGFEQNGKGKDFLRPILVLKKFNKRVFWALPLTTSGKLGSLYSPLGLVDGKMSTAILSQLRLVDAKRLLYKSAVLSKTVFLNLKKAISDILLSNDDF
ncbi:type II toxin-antitoxin system PemK/MazF family toxin [Candidatus Gracilibacteria bacterium]|nr:type II toxin-antitoxin system PemK/MazF family toxin [Candidatus Gracilibacteria bacterium]